MKRRGFRIELGEIEAALARHEAVLEVAAVARTRRDPETMIDAFVVRSAEAHAAGNEGSLRARLPLYMLPDRIIFVDAIPKGNRGKIDYAALKRMAEERTVENEPEIKPEIKTDIKAEVRRYVLESFAGGDFLDDSTPLITGGLIDSMGMISLVRFIEQRSE